MPKKSPSGSSGTSASEYNVNVPCFPSPMFPSHSHVRHVLPQIPTRAGHPRMAVSKASTRDPFNSRMPEGEFFADIITTHRLDDNLEQARVVTAELHSDSKICDRNKPESWKSDSSGRVKHMSAECYDNTLTEFTSRSRKQDRKSSADAEHALFSLTRSTSPSSMLNIDEITMKKGTVRKSPGRNEFAKLRQKESKDIFAANNDSDSDFVLNSSKSTEQSNPSSVVDSVLNPRSRFSMKHRDPGKSSLFPMFDEDDSDENGSTDSPVAMNLSLPTKSPVRLSSNSESLPKFPAPHRQVIDPGTSTFTRGSPLDAIMKMTSRINTNKTQQLTANTDAAVASGSLQHQFSTSFQSRADAWSHGSRIFGSDSSPGTSYGKIAAEGILKLPVASQASVDSDYAHIRTADEYASVISIAQPTDSSTQLQSVKLTSWEKPDEANEDSAQASVSDGNPIKLKIRRGTKGASSQLSIVTSKPSKDANVSDVVIKSNESAVGHPSPLALSLLGAAPSPSSAPSGSTKSKLPPPGRAKTKGELKKQLFERKEQRLRTDGSQASSPAGSTMTPSPARSHVETLSPLSVNVDASTPQSSPQLSSGNTNVAHTERVSLVLFCSDQYVPLYCNIICLHYYN